MNNKHYYCGKTVTLVSSKSHTIVVSPPTIMARLHAMWDAAPLADTSYKIAGPDGTISGKTDGDGILIEKNIAVGVYEIEAGGQKGFVDSFYPGDEDKIPIVWMSKEPSADEDSDSQSS